jgi:hypothetical protein
MSNGQYKWVFNTSSPRPDSQDLSNAGCRSRLGPHVDGDADQSGIYVHKDDLEKAAAFYKSAGMLAEAQWVEEAKTAA